MSFIGTYKDPSNQETLTIIKDDPNNGTFEGSMMIPFDGQSVRASVQGHYHYTSDNTTILQFTARNDEVALYEGWAGWTPRSVSTPLNVEGGRGVVINGKPGMSRVAGPFTKQ